MSENEGRTLAYAVDGFQVRAFRVEVLSGPDKGRTVVANDDVLTIGSADGNDLILSDPTVSRYHLELKRVEDRLLLVDNASTNGTTVDSVMVRQGLVRPGTILNVGRVKVRVDDADALTLEALGQDFLGDVLGRSAVMRRLMARVQRCAESDVSVLLQGETGAGKEVIARAVHGCSPRAREAFEIVDCGTLMPALIASELFGHERGAFTGAEHRHIGAFERADGGTIFLDEIGELPMALQPALLGALERKSFRRVGGQETIRVNVRVVSATHRDLRSHVNAGSFRPDLYYRLSVLRLAIPPLRERLGDLPQLIQHFLAEAGHVGTIDELIPTETMDMLRAHHWPGNVRELRNFVDAAIVLGETPALESPLEPHADHASGDFPSVPFETLLERPYHDARGQLLSDFECRYVEHLLDRTGGNVSKASRVAGLNRSYLRQLITRHRLNEE